MTEAGEAGDAHSQSPRGVFYGKRQGTLYQGVVLEGLAVALETKDGGETAAGGSGPECGVGAPALPLCSPG